VEPDQNKRMQYYYELQEILWKDLPALPLFEPVSASAYSTDYVGVPAGPRQARDPIDSVWWVKGSLVSPESAVGAIKQAEDEVAKSKGMPLTETEKATAKILEAKKAYEAGDYATAQKLANEALNLAKPPIETYSAIAITAIIIITVTTLYIRRKRKQK